MGATVIAIACNKGGVGKTTTAVNLAYGLSRKLLNGNSRPEGNVLLVDMDQQGSAADALGLREHVYDPETNPAGKCISQLLTGEAGMRDVVVSTHRPDAGLPRPNLFMIPASRDLEYAAEDLLNEQALAQLSRGRRNRGVVSVRDILNYHLGDARQFFRYIIIDCPPKLDIFKEAVYRFADQVIVPTQAHYLAGRGTQQHTADLLGLIEQNGLAVRLRLVVPTMYDTRQVLAGHVLADLRRIYGRDLVADPIPNNTKVKEAPAVDGRTVLEYEPGSSGGRAYQALVDRIWTEDNR